MQHDRRLQRYGMHGMLHCVTCDHNSKEDHGVEVTPGLTQLGVAVVGLAPSSPWGPPTHTPHCIRLSVHRHCPCNCALLPLSVALKHISWSACKMYGGGGGGGGGRGTHPSWKQPHLLIEPLTAAFQYIHQKFLVLISAFQCDLHSPSKISKLHSA